MPQEVELPRRISGYFYQRNKRRRQAEIDTIAILEQPERVKVHAWMTPRPT